MICAPASKTKKRPASVSIEEGTAPKKKRETLQLPPAAIISSLEEAWRAYVSESCPHKPPETKKRPAPGITERCTGLKKPRHGDPQGHPPGVSATAKTPTVAEPLLAQGPGTKDQDTETKDERPGARQEGEEPFRPFCKLPQDIFWQIVGELTSESEIMLSLACKDFYAMLSRPDSLIRVMWGHVWPSRRIPTLRLLLQNGADPNDPCQTDDFLGWTALHFAVYNNNKEAIEVLREHGASPNIPDKTGGTPLHLAYRRWCHREGQGMKDILRTSIKGMKADTKLVDHLGAVPSTYRLRPFRQKWNEIFDYHISNYLSGRGVIDLGCRQCCRAEMSI